MLIKFKPAPIFFTNSNRHHTTHHTPHHAIPQLLLHHQEVVSDSRRNHEHRDDRSHPARVLGRQLPGLLLRREPFDLLGVEVELAYLVLGELFPRVGGVADVLELVGGVLAGDVEEDLGSAGVLEGGAAGGGEWFWCLA